MALFSVQRDTTGKQNRQSMVCTMHTRFASKFKKEKERKFVQIQFQFQIDVTK